VSSCDSSSGFFCDLTALNESERQCRSGLAKAVEQAARARTELSNGYAVVLDASKITVDAVNQWIALERRCCPFLQFATHADSLAEALIVELTGTPGVKEFLRAEFMRS
jgi:hypothetical protein